MNDESLSRRLLDGVGRPRLERLSDSLISVLVPDTRLAHSYAQVLVQERSDGTYRLSDATELKRLLGDQREEVLSWLECAGADLEIDEDEVTSTVADETTLAERVLSFSHYVLAASVIWQAEACMKSGVTREREPSAVRTMADQMLGRITTQLGSRTSLMLRRDHSVRAAGERARAPLAVAPPQSRLPPRLIASFVDFQAAPQSITAAKHISLWLFRITNELTIPKYMVVKGSDEQVEHLGALYDPENVTAVPFDDGQQLIDDIRRVASELV